jgi:hypothetical protein
MAINSTTEEFLIIVESGKSHADMYYDTYMHSIESIKIIESSTNDFTGTSNDNVLEFKQTVDASNHVVSLGSIIPERSGVTTYYNLGQAGGKG